MSNTIKKNQVADIPTKNGNSYSYQYVDIAQIHEYLESINSKYIQQIKRIDNDDYVMTKRCFDDKWEDEWLQGARVVDATLFGNDNPAQKQGSALTYARRYSLLMAYGLATEDDDANSLNNFKEFTKEDADNYKLTFGRNQGKTLKEVQEEDPKYIEWILNNSKDERILKAIELSLGIKIPNEEEQYVRQEAMKKILDLCLEKDIDLEEVKEKFHVTSIKNMTTEQMKKCVEAMEKKTTDDAQTIELKDKAMGIKENE